MTRSAVVAFVVGVVVAAGETAHARERAPSVTDLRHAIESSSPSCRLDVDEELSLGRTKLWFVRRLVAVVDDVDPQARAILEGLRRVEVGSYRVVGDCPLPADLEADLVDGGWARTVRWQDASGRGIVLQRMNDDNQINGMLVLEIGDGSVDIVHLEGRVQDILAAAVQDDPGSTGSLLGMD